MLMQAAALGLIALADGFTAWAAAAVLLGAGAAAVYPILLAASATSTPPPGEPADGVYGRWRDEGFAVGALLAGIVADLAGIRAAI